MKTSRKVISVFLIVVFLFMTAQVVFAEAAGISLIDLLRSKAESFIGINTNSATQQLDQAKQESIDQATGYIDSYLDGMQNTLSQYTQQEVDASKIKIKAKAEEVKKALDAQGQGVIDQAKIQIKDNVDKITTRELSEFDKELSIKISSK